MSSPSENYRSEIFRISHRQLTATMILLYGSPVIMTVSALALPALLAGIFLDLRWLVIFMMVIFLITPMMLTFLYFFHGLRMSTSSNVVPHSLEISEKGITVSLYDKVEAEKRAEERAEEKREEGSEEKKIQYRYRSERFYPISQISDVKAASKGYIIQLKAPEKGFIWLSPEGFSSREDYGNALKLIWAKEDNNKAQRQELK